MSLLIKSETHCEILIWQLSEEAAEALDVILLLDMTTLKLARLHQVWAATKAQNWYININY